MENKNNIARKNKNLTKKIKGVVNFLSEKSIQNLYGESKDNLSKIRGYLNFAANELGNYFNDVTVNSNRITLY